MTVKTRTKVLLYMLYYYCNFPLLKSTVQVTYAIHCPQMRNLRKEVPVFVFQSLRYPLMHVYFRLTFGKR